MIAILATNVKTEVTYRAVFTGPDADTLSAAFVARKGSTHCFSVEEDFDEVAAPRTADALWPTCEHGLSEALCAGPGHYPAHL